MKIISIVLAISAIAGPGLANAACTTDPALELRNAFIKQYAGRGESRGAPIDVAAREGGCIFDVMSANLSVQNYIKASQAMRDGKEPTAELKALLPQMKRCTG